MAGEPPQPDWGTVDRQVVLFGFGGGIVDPNRTFLGGDPYASFWKLAQLSHMSNLENVDAIGRCLLCWQNATNHAVAAK